jgi:hypothetical protein
MHWTAIAVCICFWKVAGARFRPRLLDAVVVLPGALVDAWLAIVIKTDEDQRTKI